MKKLWNKLRSLWKKDPEFMDINPEQASLKKVLYWRLISTFISISVAYYFLHELTTSVQMTLIEAGILTAVHYVFEEVWSKKYK
jgi:uncharacterized membrane protein|tara:strand:- start:49 stop:300 length:252 start_codon:yes stop_codon:yes gene_type:complete